MEQNPYKVGDRVLASRTQDGENLEEGTVVDAYVLLISGESRSTVAVEFADGQRAYLTAAEPNVRPLPPPEEPGDDAGAEGGE